MNLADVRRTYGKTVTYRGAQWRLDKCIESEDECGGYKYSLELHDLKANSVVIVKIEDVTNESDEG
jgi:hypothetical protein